MDAVPSSGAVPIGFSAATKPSTSSGFGAQFVQGASELKSIAVNPKDPAFFLLWSALGLAGIGAGVSIKYVFDQRSKTNNGKKY